MLYLHINKTQTKPIQILYITKSAPVNIGTNFLVVQHLKIGLKTNNLTC